MRMKCPILRIFKDQNSKDNPEFFLFGIVANTASYISSLVTLPCLYSLFIFLLLISSPLPPSSAKSSPMDITIKVFTKVDTGRGKLTRRQSIPMLDSTKRIVCYYESHLHFHSIFWGEQYQNYILYFFLKSWSAQLTNFNFFQVPICFIIFEVLISRSQFPPSSLLSPRGINWSTVLRDHLLPIAIRDGYDPQTMTPKGLSGTVFYLHTCVVQFVKLYM